MAFLTKENIIPAHEKNGLLISLFFISSDETISSILHYYKICFLFFRDEDAPAPKGSGGSGGVKGVALDSSDSSDNSSSSNDDESDDSFSD